MISNFDFLVNDYLGIIKYPILVSILPVIIGGIIYFLGKVRASNYWQYHLDNKYIPFLHGIIALNNFVFRPIIILLFFYCIIFCPRRLLDLDIACIIILILVLNLIQIFGKQLMAWKKKVPENTEGQIINTANLIQEIIENCGQYLKLTVLKGVFPLLLYLSIFFVLVYTENRLVLILVFFVWFLAMIFFSLADAITEQHKTHEIHLKNSQTLKNVKIIEFLNDGKLIKYQEEDNKVKVIPMESIREIILVK